MLHDLITPNTFLISDTHFEHKSLVEFAPERFDGLTDNLHELSPSELISLHDSHLTSAWNSVVHSNDRILCLGDFAWKKIPESSSKLSGRKILLCGNHDRGPDAYAKHWVQVISNPIINIGGLQFSFDGPSTFNKHPTSCYICDLEIDSQSVRILFSHFPVFDYSNPFDPVKFAQQRGLLEDLFTQFKCDLNIHGHIHGANPTDERCINVCVEKLGMRPKTIKEVVKEFLNNRKVEGDPLVVDLNTSL
ncbi:hypothetical protein GEMRC1_008855 [Eukaryota sp. GEM-RC1]